MNCLLSIYALLLVFVSQSSAMYEGFKLFRLHPHDADSARAILMLEQSSEKHYDIWRASRGPNASIYLSTSPSGLANLTVLIKKHNVSHELLMSDLQKEIMKEKQANNVRRYLRMARTLFRTEHDYYKTVDDIYSTLDRYPRRFPFIKLEILGYTHEGRPIKALHIFKNNNKPLIWIDAGIHAREWIAPASALYFIDRLLTRGGQTLLSDYQFFIVPLVNPDGYEHTHVTDRLWRKNRAPTPGELCLGVDLNRNFPLKWGVGEGTSSRACDDTFMGSGPASELESQALIKRVTEVKDQLVLYLNLHSYGQFILTPFGFARYHYPENYENMMALGQLVQMEIQRRYNYVYQVGSSSDLLYEAAGGVDDFIAGVLKVPYTYTVELCDEGRYGFLLPASFIRTVGRQLWTAVKVFAHHM
ncbi:hypothetical protein P879_01630 [Paragonimus westermani]|uniref:Peptidase M14 domain-containing protein n=1 Tax=Paragonimus westermani TaxID=34504 RepID=A0A8T0DW21_9TREM|nr:hypothetical protein P879_01630 [Paragonimus westermani]